jgi:hypothetical protein
LLFSQIGSVVFIVLMESVKTTLGSFQYSIIVLVVLDLVAAGYARASQRLAKSCKVRPTNSPLMGPGQRLTASTCQQTDPIFGSLFQFLFRY